MSKRPVPYSSSSTSTRKAVGGGGAVGDAEVGRGIGRVGAGDREELIAISYSRDTAYTEHDLVLLSLIQTQTRIAWENWKRMRELENRLQQLNTCQIETEQQDRQASAMRARIQSLTKRQSEVVEHVAAGKTNREIAADLRISPRTVEKHLERIFDALHIPNRTALIARTRFQPVRNAPPCQAPTNAGNKQPPMPLNRIVARKPQRK